MAITLFDKPLFIRKAGYIQELASLEDAFDFLDDWPVDKRNNSYDVLMKACRFAAQGMFPLCAIRENIRRFLLRERILANIEDVPLFVRSSSGQNLGS